MRPSHLAIIVAAATLGITACTGQTGTSPTMPGAPPANGFLDQGSLWTSADRAAFYTTGQGSEIMPLTWARALTTSSGAPFLGDRLERYGYLTGEPAAELPVGFTGDLRGGTAYLGMTCAACHTREIRVDGAAYRIDGGPAFSDFQRFLADLDGAVGRVLADDTDFQAFAGRALGRAPARWRETRLSAILRLGIDGNTLCSPARFLRNRGA